MRKASLHRNKGLYIDFFFAFGAERKIVWGCKSTGNKRNLYLKIEHGNSIQIFIQCH